MSERELGGKKVNVDEEGFLTDPDEWTKEVAKAIAKEEGVELTDRHWDVINFMRKDYKEKGEPPSIRRMKNVGGIPTKELYQLFPKGPAKRAARISGLEKPKGCV